MEPNALKITKKITSKIDSGVPKKSSMITLIHSRQPSTISRTSSRLSGLNIVDRRPSNTSANRQRPATSFVSTRVSHPSSPSIGGNDKLQLSVHQLGKLPAYLRNRRPATASESATSQRLVKPKEEPFQFLASYSTFQQNKEPSEATNNDSGIDGGGPPCEGQGSGDVAALEEAALQGRDLDLKELLEKARHLAAMCDRKQERIVQLEADVAAQGRAIQERDQDMQKMEISMNKVRSLSNSRDTMAREGLQELEQKLDGVQQELTLKCNELNKFREKYSKLKQKLTESKTLLEERDKTIFELWEKDSERKTELETVKQQQQDLKLQLTTLRDELATKDALIADLRAHGPIKIAQSELDGYRTEVASLQKEVKELRFENQMLVSVKKQDDVILQIRTKLLENLERNNEAFRIQCERICGGPDEGDGENGCPGRDGARTRKVLIDALVERQWRCHEGEQIFCGADQESCKNMGTSDQLLEMVKFLAGENKRLLDMMPKCDDPSQNEIQEISNDEQRTISEDRKTQEQENKKTDHSEEQITSRTIYDEQILSNAHIEVEPAI